MWPGGGGVYGYATTTSNYPVKSDADSGDDFWTYILIQVHFNHGTDLLMNSQLTDLE